MPLPASDLMHVPPSRAVPAAIGDAEFQILCACSRARMSTDDASRLASLLEQPWDSDRLLQLAAQHGLGPLLLQHLGAHPAIPAAVRERLRDQQTRAAHETLLLTHELVRLHAQFEQHGIAALAFKGPALAQSVYGDLGLRPFADLDVLIRPRDLPAARGVVLGNGYQPTVPLAPEWEKEYVRTQYEYGFLHPVSGIYLETQWAPLPRFYSVDLDLERLWTNAQAVQLGDVTLQAPSPEDLALLLSVHAAKHAWGRLIWLVDFRELMLRYPGLDWLRILQAARAAGILRILLITLLLAQRLAGSELPSAVLAELGQDERVSLLADRVQRAITSASEEFIAPAPGHFSLLLQARERWSDRVRFVTRLALTPTSQDWNLVRLPSWLFPLYRVIRVARALRRLPAICSLAWRRT